MSLKYGIYRQHKCGCVVINNPISPQILWQPFSSRIPLHLYELECLLGTVWWQAGQNLIDFHHPLPTFPSDQLCQGHFTSPSSPKQQVLCHVSTLSYRHFSWLDHVPFLIPEWSLMVGCSSSTHSSALTLPVARMRSPPCPPGDQGHTLLPSIPSHPLGSVHLPKPCLLLFHHARDISDEVEPSPESEAMTLISTCPLSPFCRFPGCVLRL